MPRATPRAFSLKLLPPQRHLFDIPEDVAYFNCAYNSPQLNCSRDRLLAGAASKSQPWKRTSHDFFEDAEAIRLLSSKALGGDSDGYAVIPAASYGLSTAARAIEPLLQRGDGIVVMAEEFPSNVLPWRRVCNESGSVMHTVTASRDQTWTQAILKMIDERTKVVALSTCHWTNGKRIDLKRISQACRDTDSILVLDASQTLGAVPFAFDEVQPDFLVAAGYKWLLCPYGFGLLYVGERWRNSRPLEESWLARDNARNFAALADYSDNYLPGARRFDVGETCTATILPGAIAALDQLERWGVESIATSLSLITKRIASCLDQVGMKLPNPEERSPHIIGATTAQKGGLLDHLRARQIYISQRGSSLRFSPHLHCTERDVTRLVEAINEWTA